MKHLRLRHLRLTAASLLFLTLSACGSSDNPESKSSPNGSSPVVAHAVAGDGSGHDALIAGPLSMSAGCLLVGERPVIWPHGTAWDEGAQAVRLPDGEVVALGERVSGAGGFHDPSDLGPEFAELMENCPTNKYREVAMFNSQERITVTR